MTKEEAYRRCVLAYKRSINAYHAGIWHHYETLGKKYWEVYINTPSGKGPWPSTGL